MQQKTLTRAHSEIISKKYIVQINFSWSFYNKQNMLSLVDFNNAFDQAQGQENLDEPPFYLNVI